MTVLALKRFSDCLVFIEMLLYLSFFTLPRCQITSSRICPEVFKIYV
jgi:hypothetical protein